MLQPPKEPGTRQVGSKRGNTKGDCGGTLGKAEPHYKVGAGIDLGNEQCWCGHQEADSLSSSSETGEPRSTLHIVYLSIKLSCDAGSLGPDSLLTCSVLLPFRKLFLTQIFPDGGSDQ